MTAIDFALRYAHSGLSVVPVRPDGSKAAAVKWSAYQKRIATDQELRRFFVNGCGVAIIAGAVSRNLEILDFEDGVVFDNWFNMVGELDPTLAKTLVLVLTPSGGRHAYYRCSTVAGNLKLAMYPDPQTGRPETLIETRGTGGYCLAPGSPTACHEKHKPYELIAGELTGIATITAEQRVLLLDCARAFNQIQKEKSGAKRRQSTANDRPGDIFNSRATWDEILIPHGWQRVGSHHDVTLWRRPGKTYGLTATSNYKGSDLLYVFSTNAAPFEHETSYSKFAAYALLNHGGDYKATARALAQRFRSEAERRDNDAQRELEAERAAITAEAVAESDRTTERPTRYSDDALANEFSTRYVDDLRYVPSWGWLEWTGARWQRIADVRVMEKARPVCRLAAQSCRKDECVKPAVRDGLARSIASAKTVAAVERLTRGDNRHYSEVHQWDADLWAFNTPGGTIDLRTGVLRQHRREDLITKIANATPRGECPKWRAFLNRVTDGNVELQAYLQRLAGYALVGDPREECLDFFYGSGGNGKGTFLATVQLVLGEYATTAGAETFIESKSERHPCNLAKLAGARLVISNEIDEGQRWDEARIKNLTGRDVITARFMRQDFFDFMPQFTLIIAGNHRPSLKTVDESIRRRFHLVPFNVTIPADERNRNLKAELRAEADGILAWALAGSLEWQRQGLNTPDVVLAATADYLAGEDVFAVWLAECCLCGPEYEERSAWVYESFREWKKNRGESVPGHKTLSTRLTERGFSLTRDERRRKVAGLRLTDEQRLFVEKALEDRQKARN